MSRTLVAALLAVVASLLFVALLVWRTGEDLPSELTPGGSLTDAARDGSQPAPLNLPGGSTASVTVEALQESEEPLIDLASGDAGVRGVVEDPWGAPASGAHIKLYRVQAPAEVLADGGVHLVTILSERSGEQPLLGDELSKSLVPVARVVSDEQGAFLFEGVPVGEYLVAGKSPGTLLTPSLTISHMEDAVEEVHLNLLEAGTLSGRVLDPEDEAVEGADVRVVGNLLESVEGLQLSFLPLEELFLYLLNPLNARTTTLADGTFTISGLPPLEYFVWVKAPPWAPAEHFHMVPEDTPLEIYLQEAATFVGWVEDSEGEAISGATITLSKQGFADRSVRLLGGARPKHILTSRKDGSFQFEGAAAGTYHLRTDRGGYQPHSQGGLMAEPGEETEVIVTLKNGALIHGFVQSENNKPVAGIQIRGFPDKKRSWQSQAVTRTNSEGLFTFNTLENRAYRLRI
ncbi:MAG: carboxypeptidase-like regulatory domain-containing protein, partial [Planctomycetota bacterium]